MVETVVNVQQTLRGTEKRGLRLQEAPRLRHEIPSLRNAVHRVVSLLRLLKSLDVVLLYRLGVRTLMKHRTPLQVVIESIPVLPERSLSVLLRFAGSHRRCAAVLRNGLFPCLINDVPAETLQLADQLMSLSKRRRERLVQVSGPGRERLLQNLMDTQNNDSVRFCIAIPKTADVVNVAVVLATNDKTPPLLSSMDLHIFLSHPSAALAVGDALETTAQQLRSFVSGLKDRHRGAIKTRDSISRAFQSPSGHSIGVGGLAAAGVWRIVGQQVVRTIELPGGRGEGRPLLEGH
ncbi:unnamed protein product [Vitrella brassicaformis CCMP3155]|uniref:Uncharacterized protein n=1 Tax=Vitrella brassicaformis (strain CCMP3155) TaxID=1169540 RepID=A0A0G4FPK2_VITBC|nr:unnamed protein product [Vitrella brassicaformis CCMP3155]|eukprot:CEM16318.1 unnamed protein product [Vitrella brassicaformis CCMP3155]